MRLLYLVCGTASAAQLQLSKSDTARGQLAAHFAYIVSEHAHPGVGALA